MCGCVPLVEGVVASAGLFFVRIRGSDLDRKRVVSRRVKRPVTLNVRRFGVVGIGTTTRIVVFVIG